MSIDSKQRIKYKLDKFSENEFFFIFVDEEKADIKEGINTFNLTEGEHTIEIIYKREDCKNRDNAIIIEQITLFGSDEGTSLESISCPDVKNINPGQYQKKRHKHFQMHQMRRGYLTRQKQLHRISLQRSTRNRNRHTYPK